MFLPEGIPPPVLDSRLLARIGVGAGARLCLSGTQLQLEPPALAHPSHANIPGDHALTQVSGDMLGTRCCVTFLGTLVSDPDHRGTFQTLTRMLFFCVCLLFNQLNKYRLPLSISVQALLWLTLLWPCALTTPTLPTLSFLAAPHCPQYSYISFQYPM